ncbi:MAG: hypothetical protein HY695_12415 [Deltaproteobacteria bacterium]|nr:hypothetical protein [Deltaproteobacteria bacterium]
MRRIYDNEFAGMPIEELAYEDLIAARERAIETLKKELTNDEKTFLVSVKSGQPNWGVMGIEGIEKLPAIQWKLANNRKVGAKKRAELLSKLKRTLGL